MNEATPALRVRAMEVYKAFFDAQLDETLGRIRENLRDWCAVHVVVLQAGALRRGPTVEEMKKRVLDRIAPDGALLDPEVPLDDPKTPEGTVVSVMPDAIRPRIAAEYDGWTWIPFVEFRRRLAAFESAAGATSIETLFDSTDHAVALDGGSATAGPQFAKAVAMVCPAEGVVRFCDGSFGYAAPAAEFLRQAERILHMPGRSRGSLYFGDSWYAAFLPNGRVRVAGIEGGAP